MRIVLSLSILFLALSQISFAQNSWKAPAEAAAKKNPLKSSPEVLAEGKKMYMRACSICHGKTGAGDGFAAGALKRKPKNLKSVLGGQTDGAVFWKLRTGNDVMPAIKGAYSENDTWKIVSFVRTWDPTKKMTSPSSRPTTTSSPVTSKPVHGQSLHPWSSFPQGAWVDVHTNHKMTVGNGQEQAWDSDSRMTVGKKSPSAVQIKHTNPQKKIVESALLPVPAPESIAGVRAVGQWPHDIFPFGPERKSGVKPTDKQPMPTQVSSTFTGFEEVQFDGKKYRAKLIRKEWHATVRGKNRKSVHRAWVAEGIELPLKWELTVDGKLVSRSRLLKLSEPVKVGKKTLNCVVTLTKKHLSDGDIVKKRWSCSKVPGFLVKMESAMKTDGFSLQVNEWITDFATKDSHTEEELPANPPGARPALGFMPDYEADAEGALVKFVTTGGLADKGGLKADDLIVEIDGKNIDSFAAYMEVMPTLRIGKVVSVKVERGDKEIDLKIEVGERNN